MFGSKLRSWMEAVRPRKKQHRKDKQNKSNLTNPNHISATHWQKGTNVGDDSSPHEPTVVGTAGSGARKVAGRTLAHPNQAQAQAPAPSRYSANNLSSPESAYSTGYSTDGTSPGAPPDYYINIRTGVKYIPNSVSTEGERLNDQRLPHPPQSQKVPPPKTSSAATPPTPKSSTATILRRPPQMQAQQEPQVQPQRAFPAPQNTNSRLSEIIVSSPVLTSPRQRNRIRTNPWVPTGSAVSPGQMRQELPKVATLPPVTGSPIPRRFLSPSTSLRAPNVRHRSLSSSSCSSLSGTSLHHWEPRKSNNSGSEEDDCTLNEMMGKYDESYVYEKETDILSDSDPTDCDDDTDIDTGQDGGDEDDPQEKEFDFIDNGSYLELDPRDERNNTGHCTYYNFDPHQRKTSRRRTTRRSKQSSEKRRRSSSNKKRHKVVVEKVQMGQLTNGSKSAGATPLSVRRSKHHPVSKLALEDCLKKRSNSVSFSRDPIAKIDKRDKEADRKYKELIVEAEHILRTMKTNNNNNNNNGLSPRRVPGPPNKRVEILRSAECANKPELFMNKNRLIMSPPEEQAQFPKMPSSNFNCARFSPKRNHITNFMINNSPVLMRRENELPASPLVSARLHHPGNNKPASPRNGRHSPKYRKKIAKKVPECCSSSTDSEGDARKSHETGGSGDFKFGCPQSEPVRRKVYGHKTVAFNLNCDQSCKNNSPPFSPTHHRFDNQEYKNSAENLRQQVLLNTIANLKRSLEDQSASLKQVYRSSQNIHS